MRTFTAITLIAFALPVVVRAEISVRASIGGNSTVNAAAVVHHRKSTNCYPMGKGDDYQSLGTQDIAFSGDRAVTGSGQVSWDSTMSQPFAATPRRTVLTANVAPAGRGERVTITLVDQFAGAIGAIHSEDCRITDGHLSVNNATTTGSLKIQYRVPENVWGLELSRLSAEGAFSVSHLESVTSAFNKDADSKKAKNVILWVQPGQLIEQEIHVESLGSANIGSAIFEFKPLSTTMSIDETKAFLNKVISGRTYGPAMTESDAHDFILKTMELVHSGKDSTIYTDLLALHELKSLSDEYFRLANTVFKRLPDGNSVKVASALAAFQISRAVLIDMKSYCQEVDVQLPFTGETQKVLGLKAASFWLTRSMNFIRTYSYDPAEVFINELQRLQTSGLSPADIMKDKALKQKIQTSYLLLTRNMSFDGGPFNRAYVDFNKMAKTFKNIQSLGPQQATLLQQLKSANQSEEQFIQLLAATLARLRPTTTEKIDYDAVLKKIAEMRALQSALVQQINGSVRLLSIDSSNEPGQVVNQVIDLLTNQVNVFKNPVDVPYFDGIRKAFYDANVSGLDSVANGCFNIGKVN